MRYLQGGREGGTEGGREGGREGRREGGREGGRKGVREEGGEGGREGESREWESEGERERERALIKHSYNTSQLPILIPVSLIHPLPYLQSAIQAAWNGDTGSGRASIGRNGLFQLL